MNSVRYCLLSGLVLGWLTAPVCQAKRRAKFPPLEAFAALPPYTHVDEGLAPLLRVQEMQVPSLEPGDFVLFSADAAGAVSPAVCRYPLRIYVSPPGLSEEIESVVLSGGYRMQFASDTVAGVSERGSVGVARAENILTLHSEKGQEQISRGTHHIEQNESRADVETQDAVYALEKDDTSAASGVGKYTEVASTEVTAGGSHAVFSRGSEVGSAAQGEGAYAVVSRGSELGASAQGEGGLSSASGSGQVGMTAYEGAEHSRAWGKYLELLVESAGGLPGYMKGSFLYDTLCGYFDSSLDSGEFILDSIIGEYDLDPKSGVFDQDGYYVGEEIINPMKGGYVLGEAERDRFLTEITGGFSGLDELLNRECNAYLREPHAGAAGAPKLKVFFELIKPRSVAFHGGMALIQLNVKNVGDAPAFDVLAVNRVPEHSEFLFFTCPENLQQGFFCGYLDAEQRLFWRLYRPLEPGQVFKSTFLIRLDEWMVE